MSGSDYSGIIFTPRRGINPKVIPIKEFEKETGVSFCGKTGLSYKDRTGQNVIVVPLAKFDLFSLFVCRVEWKIRVVQYCGAYGYHVGEGYLDSEQSRKASFEMLKFFIKTEPSDSKVNKFISALKSGEG